MTPEERLDRIERLVEANALQIDNLARILDKSNQRIDNLVDAVRELVNLQMQDYRDKADPVLRPERNQI